MKIKTLLAIIVMCLIALHHQATFAEQRCLELGGHPWECAKLWE